MSIPSARPAGESVIGEREVVAGVLLMLLAATLQPMQDAIMKYLGGAVPAVQVAWARMVFQMLFTLPFVLIGPGVAGLLPRPYGLQILRGLFIGCTNVAFVSAIIVMPLADAIALVFVAPLVVTALSALVLGETVGPRRWTAVVIGLAGAVIIIRPGSGLFGLVALLPITAAISYACYLIVTRRLKTSAPAISTHFFTAVVSAVAISIPLAIGMVTGLPLITPVAPSSGEWGLLAVVGLISTVSHFLIILAYNRAPASTLAPMTYFEIVGATILGYLVFGDFPDAWTWVGVAVIVSSGLYVVFRARRKQAQVPISRTDAGL